MLLISPVLCLIVPFSASSTSCFCLTLLILRVIDRLQFDVNPGGSLFIWMLLLRIVLMMEVKEFFQKTTPINLHFLLPLHLLLSYLVQISSLFPYFTEIEFLLSLQDHLLKLLIIKTVFELFVILTNRWTTRETRKIKRCNRRCEGIK